MDKIVKITLIFLIIISCSKKTLYNDSLEIGIEIPEMKKTFRIMNQNGNFIKGTDIISNNVLYKIGFDDEKKIIFISTSDKKFNIGNIRVGTKLGEFENRGHSYSYGKLFGYQFKLDDEWDFTTDYRYKPSDTSKIQFFFKYLKVTKDDKTRLSGFLGKGIELKKTKDTIEW